MIRMLLPARKEESEMAPMKSKTARRPENGPPVVRGAPAPAQAVEVLNLAEAAAYLRTSEANVLNLVQTRGLPGRDIGDGWRFLKFALQHWLSATPGKKGLLRQLGAIKDDPYAEAMLEGIYSRRGRPEAEEG
jgi:excisionase family DNA binding protein